VFPLLILQSAVATIRTSFLNILYVWDSYDFSLLFFVWSRASSVSIVSDYQLDDRVIGVRFPAEVKHFSSSLCVQTGSGAHPASYSVGTRGPFPEGKARPGRDADHSPHLVSMSRMSRSYTFSPQAPPCTGTALHFCFSCRWERLYL
jgi:hypothetical protein